MFSRSIDFKHLVSINPLLAKFYDKNSNTFDFSSNQALIQLTQTLILSDLDYNVLLSENQLCPRYFNRLDYVIFINDLIKLTNTKNKGVTGLDIGTGQICIYPLLATKYINNLKYIIGTDIVNEFIESATKCISSNNLSDLVAVELVEKTENSFAPLVNYSKNDDCFTFSMANPPFYSSLKEMSEKISKKSLLKPLTIGHASELITEGGELAFILKLFNDSKLLPGVQWFTSLIGNHSTLIQLILFMKIQSAINFGVYRFKSGSFTTRWIIYWTFNLNQQPPVELFNYKSKILKSRHTKPLIDSKKSRIMDKLSELPYLEQTNDKDTIVIKLPGNCWSRAYRRGLKNNSDKRMKREEYIFEINASSIIWRKGSEYIIYESFCSWLNNKKI